jgi:hypothetical protein
VVDDSPGGADDDVHATAQSGELGTVALATVDRQHLEAGQMRGVAAERLRHLQRQLAGGREDQRLRALRRQVDAGQDRDREGGGLAGARLGQADHVAPREQGRDRRRLDRGRRLVADLGQGAEDPVVDAQVGEGEVGARVGTHRRQS